MAQESWKIETDETECQTPEGPILCANNCGFFGSATTNNLCSKCYRDLFMKPQVKLSATLPVSEKTHIAPSSVEQFEPVLDKSGKEKKENQNTDVAESSEGEKQQPVTNRCVSCRKRVGLTGFKCRCGGHSALCIGTQRSTNAPSITRALAETPLPRQTQLSRRKKSRKSDEMDSYNET